MPTRSVARGRSAAGSASPCQGEGRGFESRRPLGGAGSRPQCAGQHGSSVSRVPGAGTPGGGVAEWLRQGPAKPCTRVRFPSPPRKVPGPLAQWESASLTRKRSLVQIQYGPPSTTAGQPSYGHTSPGLSRCASPLPCPPRGRSHCASPLPRPLILVLQFALGEPAEAVGDRPLAGVTGVQVDRCGPGTAVSHPVHQLAQCGSRR
jgi:hypothetical protein